VGANPTRAESQLIAAVEAGQDQVFDPAKPKASRTIRAVILADLLTGVIPSTPAKRQCVVLHNAVVTGILDLTHARRSQSDAPLLLLEAYNCEFEASAKFCDTRLAGLRLIDCRLPGFKG